MNRLLTFRELKSIIFNKKILIPIIAILAIPILYAGMFLWAFWDPYDYLSELPVAIVNEDEGAVLEGEKIDLGNELVDNLKEENDFQFHFVNKDKGYEDLLNQAYYVLIEIPRDFSENATTLLDSSPKKLELVYLPNESYNFLSAQIGETAMLQIEAALEEKVIETYAETMFDTFDDINEGFVEASDGAKKLADGSIDINDGTKKIDDGVGEIESGTSSLKDHLQTLAESSIAFQDGTTELQAGSQALAQGMNELSNGLNELNQNSPKLTDGASEVKEGANEIASGAQKSKDGLKEVSTQMGNVIEGTTELQTGANVLTNSLTEWKNGAQQTASGAEALNEGLIAFDQKVQSVLNQSQALPEEVKQELLAALGQLKEGSKELAQGTNTLNSSTEQLVNGSSSLSAGVKDLTAGQQALKQGVDELYNGNVQLADGAVALSDGQSELLSGLSLFQEKLEEASNGSKQLASGANELANGSSQLVEGSHAFVDGSEDLANGAKTIAAGATELHEGTSELADGTKELVDGTGELKEKLGDAAEDTKVDVSKSNYEMMANPVEVETESVHEVPNYGTGFAPYFLSLGLFVGALLLSIVYPLREPATTPKTGWHWFMSKFVVLGIIGILQAVIASVILLVALDLQVQSIPLFILFAIFTSLTFITLIQFFVTCFGDPGRFIAIIILILQLTTSAGTFPLELIPNALQHFNSLLPMTYSVQGFKAVISSGEFATMWKNATILLSYTLLFIVGSLSYFLVMFKRKYNILTKEEASA